LAVFVRGGSDQCLGGSMIGLACANGVKEGLTIRNHFLLTTAVLVECCRCSAQLQVYAWARPEHVSSDAVFEANRRDDHHRIDGILTGLDESGPKGLLLWRCQSAKWLGGYWYQLLLWFSCRTRARVGGMQIFKSKPFVYTLGKNSATSRPIASQDFRSIYCTGFNFCLCH